MSQDLGAVGVEESFLLLSSKQLVDEELCWQFGSTSPPEYIIVEKDPNLQLTADQTTKKNRDCGRQTGIELEWPWLLHEQGSPKCELLTCPYCKDKKKNDCTNILHDAAVGETRSTESRPAQLLSLEGCAVEGFNRQHVRGRSPVCFLVPQNHQHHASQPLSSHGTSLTACPSERDQQQLRIAQLLSLPSSNSLGDWALLCQRFQSAPPPHLVISSILQNQHCKFHRKSFFSSFEDRSISWSMDTEIGNVTAKPEKLSAALCHSQARARNAEKAASETLIEKDKLAKLYHNEANTCCTYKKKIELLELENLWLKANVVNYLGMRCELLPYNFNASASRHCKFYKRGFSKEHSSTSGTIGLAFALGLSCASAGFVLGCCMGLIGLSQ